MELFAAEQRRSTGPASMAGRWWPYLLFGAALGLKLLSDGGSWDLALAAWLYPIAMLRFVRTRRARIGLPLVFAVEAAGVVLWYLVMASSIPFEALTFVGCLVFGLINVLPYALDLAVSRGPLVLRLLAFPLAWLAVEFLLGTYGPLGTAYDLSAVTQLGNPAMLQIPSVAGPYAIAFLMGLVAAGVNHWWHRGFAFTRAALGAPVVALAVVAVAVVFGEARLAFGATPSSPTVRIAGINPSSASLSGAQQHLGVSPTDLEAVAKVGPQRVRAASAIIDDQLLADTVTAAHDGAKIVVWSENSARFLSSDEDAFLAKAETVAREQDIYLDVAANVFTDQAPAYGHDQTTLISPRGTVLWTYQKRHPIPGMENYVAGSGSVPVVDTPYGRIANVICYDADFPALMRVNADIMLVPGGDWPAMGRTHTQMASLRAVENGYSLVRQDFDGESGAFDPLGNVLSQQDTTTGAGQVWITDVPEHGTTTLYRLTGDVVGWLGVAGTLLALAYAASRRQRAPRTQPAEVDAQ